MSSGLVFRPASPADSYALAELSIMGGDGMYEFLLEEMAPREMLAGLMARTMKQGAGGFSWRNCFVAEGRGVVAVVAMINAFPAAWLRDEDREILPQDRVRILDPIDQVQDWDSFLINSVAVRPPHRRQGVATRLLDWAIEQARAGGFGRLTMQVWEDNVAARALCEKQGFRLQTRVEVPQHPGLAHIGGNLLMTLEA